MMVKNKYPFLLISEIISQLHRAKYFLKLDVQWGFNNVYIKPGCHKLHLDLSPSII